MKIPNKFLNLSGALIENLFDQEVYSVKDYFFRESL